MTFTGKVASEAQLNTVLAAAKSTAGVKDVVSKIEVSSKTTTKPVTLPEAVVQPAVAPVKEAENTVLPASAEEPPQLIEETSAVSSRDASITERVISKLSAEKDSGGLRTSNSTFPPSMAKCGHAVTSPCSAETNRSAIDSANRRCPQGDRRHHRDRPRCEGC